MAATRLLNLIALATIAILASSFGPQPANALSNHGAILQRDFHHGHGSLARKKRHSLARRCKKHSNGSNAPPASVSPPTPVSGDTSYNNTNTENGNNGGDGGHSNSSANIDINSGSNNTVTYSGNNSATPSSSGGGSGNGRVRSSKVCLAWPNGDDPALANFGPGLGGMLYTWSPHLPTGLHGYQGARMLWGPNQVDDFVRLVEDGSGDGSCKYILGPNEPDQPGQSNMSPQDAAALWQKYIQPLASRGYRLITPACTSDPRSKQWMKDFFDACKGCTFDALALHYYDVSADHFIEYLKDFHNTFNLPVWVTEFACQNFNGGAQCSYDEIQKFMETAVNFMESTDWVQQYCWFGAMHDMQNVNSLNQLMGSDGKPTSLALKYLFGV